MSCYVFSGRAGKRAISLGFPALAAVARLLLETLVEKVTLNLGLI